MLTATLYSFRHHRYTLDPRCSNFDKLRTLGRLMGAALRTGVRLPLAFPSLVWKQLVGQELGMGDLEAVDQFLVRSVVKVSVVEGCVLSNLGGGI